MSLFGAGGVVIAGKHVSYGLLAVMLSVPVAALAIYQFRSGAIGGGGVGTSTGTPDKTGDGGGGGGASDAALQNLGQQISDMVNSRNASDASMGQQISSLAALFARTSPYSTSALAAVPGAADSSRYLTTSRAVDLTPASSGSPGGIFASLVTALAPSPAPSPAPAPEPYSLIGSIIAAATAAPTPSIYQQSPPVYSQPAPAPSPWSPSTWIPTWATAPAPAPVADIPVTSSITLTA